MRRVLTYVVVNGERLTPASALDCLEALKTAPGSTSAQGADRRGPQGSESAVRMKALESLRIPASDDDVRQATARCPGDDGNPGVRVEAVNVLVVFASRRHR